MLKEGWLRFKRFVLPYPMAFLVKYLLRLLLWTCKIEIVNADRFESFAKCNRCILSLWHNRLAIIPELFSKYTNDLKFTAVISKSRDGEPLAVLVHSYKKGNTIRVAHDDRHGALKKLIKHLKSDTDVLVITPDGPRGPCYALKPGVIAAAKLSNAYVVPFDWTANHFWELKTWDKFRIPKPFSTIQATFGDPIEFSKQTSLEEDAGVLQDAMNDVQRDKILIAML